MVGTHCHHINVNSLKKKILHWFINTHTRTPDGGSHKHWPLLRLAYMGSPVLGSIISTQSTLKKILKKLLSYSGLKVNDQLVAYATRFFGCAPKKLFVVAPPRFKSQSTVRLL